MPDLNLGFILEGLYSKLHVRRNEYGSPEEGQGNAPLMIAVFDTRGILSLSQAVYSWWVRIMCALSGMQSAQ